MDLRFSTPLSLEECIQRLHNAIDPLPPLKERARSGLTTTWAPRPLPAAGRRTTGFGYAPGTRPVVGTLTDHHFHLEKKVVASNRNGKPIIRATCSGEFSAAENGTLIVVDIQHSENAAMLGAGCMLVVAVGLLALLTAPLLMQLLLAVNASGTGSRPLSAQDVGFGLCFPVLFLVVVLGSLLGERSADDAETRYLITFLEQTCDATRIVDAPAPVGRAYTGKTQRLS